MEKLNLQNLENEITCSVCQEHYTEPKVLPCLHYYCKKCILQLAHRGGKDEPFSCPLCRCETKLPDGGVDELKSAFFVNNFKSHFSALELAQDKMEVKCEACSSGGTAIAFCRQCAMFICNTCAEAHQQLKMMFEGHQVVSVQDLKKGKGKAEITTKEPSPAKCPAHQELLKVYCFNCDLLICQDCTVKDHRDHNFEFSAVAAPKTKEELLKKLEPLTKIVKTLSTTIEEVQTTKQEVEVQGYAVANTIHTSFNEQFKIMEARKQEMLEEAARLVQEKMDKLTVQQKDLSLAVTEVQSVVDYTEQCVNHYTDNEVMSTQVDIRRRIEQETEEHSKSEKGTEIVELADIGVEVMCADDMEQLYQTKTKVTRLTIDPMQCTMIGNGMKSAQLQQVAEFNLIVRLYNGKTAKHKVPIIGHLNSFYDGSIIQCDVNRLGPGEYRIHYTPTVRGRHELTILVNGQHVAGSPFPVFVSIHPTQLGKPVSVWDDIAGPNGVFLNSDGDVLIAKQIQHPGVFYKGRKLLQSIDKSQLKLTRHRSIDIPVDNVGYIYITTYNFNDRLKQSKCKDSKQHSVDVAGYKYIQRMSYRISQNQMPTYPPVKPWQGRTFNFMPQQKRTMGHHQPIPNQGSQYIEGHKRVNVLQQPVAMPSQQMKYIQTTQNKPVLPVNTTVVASNPVTETGGSQSNAADSQISSNFLQLLCQSDPQQQKQLIGEQLYRQIYAIHKEFAGKITGMLLDMDNSELLHMLEVPKSLKAKVEEAVDVLHDHQMKDDALDVAVSPMAPQNQMPIYPPVRLWQGRTFNFMPQQKGTMGHHQPVPNRGGQNIGGHKRMNMSQQPVAMSSQQMKFNWTIRNEPAPPTTTTVVASSPVTERGGGPAKATESQNFLLLLTQSDPQQQKQLIGEQLYRQIYALHKDLAGKITGMLLEMDNSELLHILEVPESLKAKVEEAVNVLHDHHMVKDAAPDVITSPIAMIKEVIVCQHGKKGIITLCNSELNYVRRTKSGKRLNQLCAITTDSAGNIYAIDPIKLLIHVFTPQGNLLRSFCCVTEGEKNPNSLCVADQFVYVCNHDNKNVTVFTTAGRHVTTFGQLHTKNVELNQPFVIHVDIDGFVYIYDDNNHRVHVF